MDGVERDLGEPCDVSRSLRHDNRAFGSLPYQTAPLPDFLFGRILRNARTSTGTRQATTALRAHASASSMSAASSIQKPPTCSLVSRDGPSVMTTSPPRWLRNDFALAADSRLPAKNLAPAASISWLSALISRIIASPSRCGS